MASPLSPLYAIADADAFGASRLTELVEVWVDHGVRCVQLRMKGADDEELFRVGQRCAALLESVSGSFWINDSVSVARDLGATGVHLGQEDMTPEDARNLLLDGQIIGCSTHSLAQAMAAAADPDVDVIAVGPVFSTQSKRNPDPVIGLEQLALIRRSLRKPLVAIGGINLNNCRTVIDAGADSVAVIGALKGPEGTLEATGIQAQKLLSLVRRES